MILHLPELYFERGANPRAAPWPRLARLLARADLAPAAADDLTTDLARWFGFAAAAGEPLPIAHWTAAFDRPAIEVAGGVLVRADPVHLRADPRLVLLVAAEHLDLTADEADALLDALRAELPDYGWSRGADPRRWYAALPADVPVDIRDPGWLHGRSLTPYLPASPASRPLRRLLNETQMVLHAAAVNAGREARGAPSVNGLWLWGAAAMPARSMSRVSAVFGNDVLAAGLARATDLPWAAHCDTAALLAAEATGEALVVCGSPHGVADAAQVTLGIDLLERDVLPTLDAGAIRGVELRLATLAGRFRPAHRFRVWRRPGRIEVAAEGAG